MLLFYFCCHVSLLKGLNMRLIWLLSCMSCSGFLTNIVLHLLMCSTLFRFFSQITELGAEH